VKTHEKSLIANSIIHYHHSEPEKSLITWAVTNIMGIFLIEILAIQVYSVNYSVCEMENYIKNITLRKFLQKRFFARQKIFCIWNVINKEKSALSVIFVSFLAWRKSGCTGRQNNKCALQLSVYNLQQNPCYFSQLAYPRVCQQHHYCQLCFLISKAWFFFPKLLRAMLPFVPFKGYKYLFISFLYL